MTSPVTHSATNHSTTSTKTAATSSKMLARTAGLVYLLLMAVVGGYANLGVRASILVANDAATSAANLAANAASFRLALVADIVMATAFVVVGVLLFQVFRHVSRTAAAALVVFVTVGAGMILTNLLVHQAALLVGTDATFSALRSDELVLLLLELHGHGYALAGIFFGLWLLPLSYLAYRSRLFPRPLSVLLAVAGISWIVETVVTFLFPGLPDGVSMILTAPRLAEFWLIAYLVVKGVRTPSVEHLTPSTDRA